MYGGGGGVGGVCDFEVDVSGLLGRAYKEQGKSESID